MAELKGGGIWKYYGFYEEVGEERQEFWDSGNPAAIVIFGSKGPDAFPTILHPEGKNNKCLKLETKSTGILGAMMKMYLAAGNLFIGEFESANATKEPLKATHFGVPFSKEPVALTGYYKYKSGEKYNDDTNTIIPGKKDIFDIYAILFEVDDEVKYLDGANSLTSPNLVSIARIEDKDKKETDEWTYFNVPFKLQPGKEFDIYKQYGNKYYFSLVMASSIDGARFMGSAGSTLLIDEVEVHCKE